MAVYRLKEQRLLDLMRLLLKNSKRSDRDLAKEFGVSQPTITRMRGKLEKEGYIETYTIVPDFTKLGYNMLVFTFVKMKYYPTQEEALQVQREAMDWVRKRPNVIFAADGQGLGGKDVVIVSFHKDYSKYTDFIRSFALDWGRIVGTFESFTVDVASKFKMKALDLKYLADDR